MAETKIRIGDHRVTIRHPEGAKLQFNGGKLTIGEPEPEEINLKQEIENAGIKWGDALAWATSQVGLKQCGGCHARQLILNQAKQLGLKETIRQIKETFK